MKPDTLTPCPSPRGRGEYDTPTTTMGTWCATWCPPSPAYGRGESGNPRRAALAPSFAATLGIAQSTVCTWRRDRPLGRAAARSLGTPRMTARLAARYESLPRRPCRLRFRNGSLANASGYDGAGSVNGGPAKKRMDWRKSLGPKDLRLRSNELSSVSRSATLPNEVLQKRGAGRPEARGRNNCG